MSANQKPFKQGEIWRVLGQTRGDDIGLPRGTKILVTEVQGQETITLSALAGDWTDEPRLTAIPPARDAGLSGAFDPLWMWEGSVIRADKQSHQIKVGTIEADPGILAIFVNPDGMATIER